MSVTSEPELCVDPEKCPGNAAVDRLIQRRITEALKAVFSNLYIGNSGTPVMHTTTDEAALEKYLREGWNP